MRKKALLSLIVASPAALTGFANINLSDEIPFEKEAWPAYPVVGDGYATFGENLATLPYPGEYVSTTVKNLPAGTYKLSFSSLTNATVSVNDEVVIKDGASEGQFTLKEASDVVVKIANASKSGTVSFAAASLSLVCDFQAIQNAANAALAVDDFTELTQGADADGKIAKEIADYNKALSAIKMRVLALYPEGTKAEALKIYADEVLVNGYEDSKLAEDIAALVANHDAIEEEIVAENARYKVELRNLSNKTAAENKLAEFEAAVAADKAIVEATGEDALSDYVKGIAQPDYEAFAKAVADAKDAIAKAFTDEAVKSGETIQYSFPELELSQLKNKFDTDLDAAQADEAAYAQWKEAKDALDKAYEQALSTIQDEISGDKYAASQAEVSSAVKDAYDTAIADSKIKQDVIVGAENTSAADIETLNNAKDAIEAAVSEVKAVKDANEQGYTGKLEGDYADLVAADEALNKAITALQTRIDAIGDVDITTALADKVKTIKDKDAAAEEALAAYKQALEDAYNNVEAADFDADGALKQGVSDKIGLAQLDIDQINDRLAKFEANKELTDDLQTKLDTMKGEVKEAADAAKLTLIDVPAKFKETYATLQGSIDSLVKENKDAFVDENKDTADLPNFLADASDKLSEISDGINTTKDNAVKVIDGFSKAEKALADWTADKDAFAAAIDAKVTIQDYVADKAASKTDEKTAVVEDTTYSIAEIEADLVTLRQSVMTAANQEQNSLYDAIVKVLDESINPESTIGTKIAAERSSWLLNVSEDNYTAANKALETIATELAKYENLPGYDAAKEVYDAQAKVVSDARTVLDSKADPLSAEDEATLDTDVDKALQAFNPDGVKAIQDKIDLIIANEAAHDALVASAADLSDLFDATYAFNEKTAVDPAQTYYKGVIDNKKAEYDTLVAAIEASYQAVTSKADSDTQDGSISAISSYLTQLQSDIQNNEVNHNTLLQKSSDTLERIQDIIEELKGYVLSSDDQAAAEATLVDLTALNKEVSDAFAKGELSDSDKATSFIDRYDEITAAAEAVLAKYLDEYQTAVKEANELTLQESGWNANLKQLKETYYDGIESINALGDIYNAGYRAYVVEQGLPSHEALYSYSTKIYDLEKEVKALLDNSYKTADTAYLLEDEQGAPITALQAPLDELAQAQTALEEEIQGIYDQFTALADAYYQQEFARATGVVNDAKDAMSKLSDGIIAKYTKNEEKILANAERSYNANSEGDLLHEAVGCQDGIADHLDLIQSIDTAAAAVDEWKLDYNASENAEANSYRDRFDQIVADFNENCKSDPNPEQFTQWQKGTDSLLNVIDEDALADEDLLNTIDTYQNRAEQALAKLQDAYNESKTRSDNAVQNKATYDALASDIADAQAQLDALKAYVGDLAADVDQQIDAAQQAIDDATSLNDQLQNSYVSSSNAKATVDNAINNALLYIDQAYVKAYESEVDAIAQQAEAVKTYFNDNAVTLKERLEDARLKEINAEINAIIDFADQNADAPSDVETIKSDDTKKALLDKETEINNIYQELAKALQEDPVADIQKTLADASAAVSDQIAEIESAIENSDLTDDQKAEFADQITNLKDQLTAANSAVEAAGNNVLTQGDKLADSIADVAEAVVAEQAVVDQAIEEAAAIKAAHDASDARYEELAAQLADFQAQYQAVKDLDDSYEYNLRSTEELQFALEEAEEYLEEDKAAYALTADSQLERLDDIVSLIAGYTNFLNVGESQLQTAKADEALNEAAKVLAGDIANAETLASQYEDLAARYDELKAAVDAAAVDPDFSTEDAAKLIEEAKSIAEGAAALAEEAEANVYVAGDLNEDGQVSTSDFSALVSLIVNGAGEVDTTDKVSLAADLNGDGYVNASDVVRLAKALFGETAAKARLALAAGRQSDSNFISADLVEGENGATRIAINLNNAANFVAGQFDIKLPAGMSIVSESLTSRADGLQLVSADIANGYHRIVIASIDLNTIASGDGALVYLDVTGTGNVQIDNAFFADKNALGYEVKSNNASGIGSMIYDSLKSGAQKIYDASGRLMNRIQRGFNIIRNSDGTTTKKISKNDK